MPDLPPSATPTTPEPAPGAGQGAPPGPVARERWWKRKRQSRKTPERPCLNCGDTTIGWFCPTCGQRKIEVRISLRRMLREAMDDQLSVNSTLPRTLGALFFRPGHLTREYVQGRMVRYIPPFRLYLVSSLLFFVVLGFVADPREIAMQEEGESQVERARTERIADSVLLAHARTAREDTTAYARKLRERPNRNPGQIQFGPDPEQVPQVLKPLARRMKEVEARLNSMPRREALRTVIETFEENAPFGVFVMMPLFALILKLIYARRKRFYVEHFVFALHAHAFAFLAGTITLLSRSELLDAMVMVWLLIYLFMALKRFYEQGIVRTAAKYMMLGVSYSLLLMVGVTATVLLTALSL